MKQQLDRFLYYTYKSTYPSVQRRRNKFTTAGYTVLGAIVTSAVFGLDTTKAVIYQLFTLLTALFFSSFLCSLFFRARFNVRRDLPPFATEGENLRYTISVHNLNNKAKKGLLLQELPQIHYPSFDEFISSREPGEANRNHWDQRIKLHRFQWLMEQNIRVTPQEQMLPSIGPNSFITAYAELKPTRRGYLELKQLSIKQTDPFGLFKSIISIPEYDRLLILPKRYPLPPIKLPGSRKYQAGGISLASSVGNAFEFRTLREYRPGDPMRMLHWKSIAKTGELIIRENEDEYFERHALILDTFSEQPHSNIFEAAVSVAASFACTVGTQESLLDLMFVEDQAYCFSTGRGVDHTGKLLELLACVETCTDKPFSELMPLVEAHAAQLSGCICILQAWDEQRDALVSLLSKYNVPCQILVIIDGDDPPESGNIPIHTINANHPSEGLALL